MTSLPIDEAAVKAHIATLAPAGSDTALLTERSARAMWSCLIEPGDATAGALIRTCGARAALQHLAAGTLPDVAAESGLDGRDVESARRRWSPRLDPRRIEFAVESAARSHIRLVVPGDAAWPQGLDDLGPHAPVCLWVRGHVDALALTPSVGIVGARAATAYGEQVAAELGAELSGGGIPIVSGGAYGIDGAAHRAALSTGGVTVALSAGGVDRPYPSGHADLLARVAQAGAVVGEAPCGVAPTRWRFLQRNRCIAALSAAMVVVEAGVRSGSLNTAGHAAALGRPLGAVPGPVTSASSAGCHRLLREFDARCVTDADDVRELLGVEQAGSPSPRRGEGRTDDTTRITDALSRRDYRDLDDIARRCGMDPAQITSRLGMLELAGEVESAGGRWRRAASTSRR